MVQMTLNLNGGIEPEVLAKLIDQRMRVMNETAKDATIATAMNVLVSLRSQTRVAKFDSKSVKDEPGVTTRWERVNGRNVRNVRDGGNAVEFKNIIGKYQPGENPLLFRVIQYENGNPTEVLILCRSRAQAEEWAKKRFKRYSGMAKSAWGHSMRLLGQRTSGEEGLVTSFSRKVIDQNVRAEQRGGEWDYAVTILNDLDYATAAMKNGEASVSLAMQSAANKTAGILQQHIKTHLPSFDPARNTTPTPFPDIVRRSR